MYAEMMRRMQQKDVEKKKKETKAAIEIAADAEVKPHSSIIPPLGNLFPIFTIVLSIEIQ
jgi:hypothetical protein